MMSEILYNRHDEDLPTSTPINKLKTFVRRNIFKIPHTIEKS